MPAKSTTAEFIEKAKKVHFDKYDYGLVNYTNNATKISIICRECGKTFLQVPYSHLNGHGCPYCSNVNQKTTEQFISDAKKVHFENYDYGLVNYKNAHTKISIICRKCGKTFIQKPNTHLNGKGCPYCSSEKIANSLSMTTAEFISKAKKIHFDKYDYSLVDYKNNKEKVKIICKIHGEFLQSAGSHLNGNGCPSCSGRKKSSTAEFIEKAKKIHFENYDYSLVDYKNAHTKISIICKKHGEFKQKPNDHLKGVGCPICGGSKKSNTAEFIEKAKKVHSDKYDYGLVNYVNANTKVKIICRKHGEFLQAPHEHLKGCGCPNCAKNKKKSTAQFISESKLLHGDFYDYSLVDYKNNKEKVKIICPKHGVFEQVASYHLDGNGCPLCNMSIMEHQVFTYLKQLEIQFVREYSFPDCRDKLPLPFDFYIPSKNLLIECNGIQHYQPVEHFGGRKEFLLQKHHDWLKRKYAKKNGIELLVIRFDENVHNTLSSYLYEIF